MLSRTQRLFTDQAWLICSLSAKHACNKQTTTYWESLKTHALELCAHVSNSNMPITVHVSSALCLSYCKLASEKVDNL